MEQEKKTLPLSINNDTNYIGITINDDAPKLYRHQSLNEIRHLNNNNSLSSPRTFSFPPRYSQVIFEETEEPSEFFEMSGAFRKIKSSNDLPMSHHHRIREGKRYGV